MDPDKLSLIPVSETALPERSKPKPSVYMDGACWNNGKVNVKCGSGIWISLQSSRNAVVRVPGPKQSNQIGELAAVVVTASSVPIFYPLTIITDSRYVIDGLTDHLEQWEDEGWIKTDNADVFK